MRIFSRCLLTNFRECQRGAKSRQHPKVFLRGPPPQYLPGPLGLNFRVQMGSGVFPKVWPSAKTGGVASAQSWFRTATLQLFFIFVDRLPLKSSSAQTMGTLDRSLRRPRGISVKEAASTSLRAVFEAKRERLLRGGIPVPLRPLPCARTTALDGGSSTCYLNLPGWRWGTIKQIPLVAVSRPLHSGVCETRQDAGLPVLHSKISDSGLLRTRGGQQTINRKVIWRRDRARDSAHGSNGCVFTVR